jgi:hypothetical protein
VVATEDAGTAGSQLMAFQPPPVQPFPPQYGYGRPPLQTDSTAIVALTCGILSLPGMMCCSLFALPLSIAAVVTGFVALSNIDKRPDELTGRGLAWGGIATGAVGMLLLVVLLAVGLGGAIIEHFGK